MAKKKSTATRRKESQAAAVRAAAIRAEQERKERRRRSIVVTLVGTVVLALVLVIGYIVQNQRDTTGQSSTAPAGAVGYTLPVGKASAPVKVTLYEDFICPHCEEFETAAGTTIDQLVAANKVTVQYHPIAILDRSSTTEYSTRAAAASAAAAQGGKFAEYHKALFANQPEEGSAGLDNAKLIELGKSVGLTDAAFADAVNNGTYKAWATKATDTAGSRGVSSTPTVQVAGKTLESPTAQALIAAVGAAGA